MTDEERQELCKALLVYIPTYPRQRKAVLELKRLAAENKKLRRIVTSGKTPKRLPARLIKPLTKPAA
jgi:hypothetical protein